MKFILLAAISHVRHDFCALHTRRASLASRQTSPVAVDLLLLCRLHNGRSSTLTSRSHLNETGPGPGPGLLSLCESLD